MDTSLCGKTEKAKLNPELVGGTSMLERYLDHYEAQGSQFSDSHVIEYEGHVDEAALSRALHMLSGHYPVLRCRIRNDGTGYLLYLGDDSYPELAICDGDERMVRDEARRPWDAAQAVFKLTLIRGEGRGFIVLRATHSIGDGAARMAWIGELWRLYTDIVNGVDIVVPSEESLPRSCYEMLESRAGIDIPPSLASDRMPAPVELFDSINRNVWLDEENTRRLISTVRAEKTTVNAVICGAALIAQRELGNVASPTPMICMTMVNLRGRVNPPVGATEVTYFDIVHKAKVCVPASGNSLDIGRVVKEHWDNSIERREFSVAHVQSSPPPLDTPLDGRLATLLFSGSGVVPRFSQPPGLKILDLFAQRAGKVTSFPVYSARTYEGRLNLRFDYPSGIFTDQEVDRVVARTVGQLRDF